MDSGFFWQAFFSPISWDFRLVGPRLEAKSRSQVRRNERKSSNDDAITAEFIAQSPGLLRVEANSLTFAMGSYVHQRNAPAYKS